MLEYLADLISNIGTHQVLLVSMLITALALLIACHQFRRFLLERSKRTAIEVELQKLEVQLSDRDRFNTAFLGNMAHDLRSPLNSILGFSRLIARDENIPQANRQHVNIINRNGEHLLGLINEILDFSKIEAGKVVVNTTEFDLKNVLDEVGLLIIEPAHAKNLRFNPMIDESSRNIQVFGDKEKLKQVLLNLLFNAVKYTNGHQVTLGARTEPMDESLINLHIDVEDSGPGLPEHRLATIFLPFERIDRTDSGSEGAGLGLAISKSLVEIMGGEISVKNTDVGGSRFSIALPLRVASRSELWRGSRDLGHPYRLRPNNAPVKMLVADDEADSRLLLETSLRRAGFEVKGAQNGREAYEVFCDWAPDFVWMDVQMPVLNGIDATRKIRRSEFGKNVKIVAFTAHAFSDQRSQILSAGFDDMLLKPCRENEMFKVIQELLPVEFDFKEEVPLPKVFVQISETDLAELTDDLIEQMLRAVHQSHNEKMHDLINLIPNDKAEFSSDLRLLVDACEWEKLEQLLNDRVARH